MRRWHTDRRRHIADIITSGHLIMPTIRCAVDEYNALELNALSKGLLCLRLVAAR